MSSGKVNILPLEALSLWEFSITVYANTRVEKQCLQLQDECGADVNLLLACCWYGISGRAKLGPDKINELRRELFEWQNRIVRPLRHLRRNLKLTCSSGSLDALYHHVQRLELLAEKAEQNHIAETLQNASSQTPPDLSQRYSDALENLQCYADTLSNGSQKIPQSRLYRLLDSILSSANA